MSKGGTKTQAKAPGQIRKPYYPIVYVRGYAMTAGEREQVFNDGYYGFAITSVERRQAPPPQYFEADIFEGLLIRLMKDHGYVDAVNAGLRGRAGAEVDPTRSLWVSRFYDQDFFQQKIRSIEEHAEELRRLICVSIPQRLKDLGVSLADYKVILIAHSMGGLVCRTLIQNTLPNAKRQDDDVVFENDPKKLIHRFVTMGTPHRGIDLGSVPDFIENAIVSALNPFDSSIFKEQRMRKYLKLEAKRPPSPDGKPWSAANEHLYDLHSLGADEKTNPNFFPVKRCLSIVGSDWSAYGEVRRLTGGFSDGLVRQDNAYLVAGPAPVRTDGSEPPEAYPEAQRSHSANVHRAHSGHRGIVNSYESYENIQRFLFGDTKVDISLDGLKIDTPRDGTSTYFYDVDFAIAIRGTNSFLHRREQSPCENAMRLKVGPTETVPASLHLHASFLNSALRAEGSDFSHFLLRFRFTEYRVEERWLWDIQYPGRIIFAEDAEVRVDAIRPAVEYRWLSDATKKRGEEWVAAKAKKLLFRIPFRDARAVSATITITASSWNDDPETCDG